MKGSLCRVADGACNACNGSAPGLIRLVAAAGLAVGIPLAGPPGDGLAAAPPVADPAAADPTVAIISDDSDAELPESPDAAVSRATYEAEGEMVLPAAFMPDIFPDSCRKPCWTATLDALLLWRGNLQSQTLFTDLEGREVLDANEVYPPVSAGPRIGLMRQVGCDHFIEGNYFYVDSFEGSRDLPDSGGPFTLRDLGGLPPFEQITSGGIRTSATIQSAEINWRRWDHGSVTWLAGFRWVEWNETANVFYENASPQLGENILTETGNDLYGGQIGADVMVWNRPGPIRANVVAKAGVFFNDAFQGSSAAVTIEDVVIPQGDVAVFANHTSFFGEISCNATWELTHWLAWRAGYSLFWLSGVATAPQQLAVSNIPEETGAIDTEGSVLLHGATTGLEFRW
jgi:hypothetical protein